MLGKYRIWALFKHQSLTAMIQLEIFLLCLEAFKPCGQINVHIFDARSVVSWGMHKLEMNVHYTSALLSLCHRKNHKKLLLLYDTEVKCFQNMKSIFSCWHRLQVWGFCLCCICSRPQNTASRRLMKSSGFHLFYNDRKHFNGQKLLPSTKAAWLWCRIQRRIWNITFKNFLIQ